MCECGGGGDACDLCFANLVCECVLCGIARLCLSLCAKWCVFCVLFCSSVSEHIYIYRVGASVCFEDKTVCVFLCKFNVVVGVVDFGVAFSVHQTTNYFGGMEKART